MKTRQNEIEQAAAAAAAAAERNRLRGINNTIRSENRIETIERKWIFIVLSLENRISVYNYTCVYILCIKAKKNWSKQTNISHYPLFLRTDQNKYGAAFNWFGSCFCHSVSTLCCTFIHIACELCMCVCIYLLRWGIPSQLYQLHERWHIATNAIRMCSFSSSLCFQLNIGVERKKAMASERQTIPVNRIEYKYFRTKEINLIKLNNGSKYIERWSNTRTHAKGNVARRFIYVNRSMMLATVAILLLAVECFDSVAEQKHGNWNRAE